MALLWIYFKANNEYGNVKALVREEDIHFFETLGTIYRTPSEMPEEPEPEPEPEPIFKPVPEPENMPDELKTDPNKGHGEVGSYYWHLTQIKSMDTMKQVIKYTKDYTGKKISAKGPLINVKIKALATIKEFMNHDDENK